MRYIEIGDREVFFDCEKLRYVKNKGAVLSFYQPTVNFKQKERLSKLVILISNSCNLCCSYCFSENGSYSFNEESFSFQHESIKKSFNNLFDLYPMGIRYLEFFGGEPLIHFSRIQETIEIVEQICDEKRIPFPIYSMVTNGTLLNENYVNYLNEKSFFITISIDGNKKTHDKTRYDSHNRGSYSTIQANLEKYQLKHLFIEFSIYHTMIEEFSPGFVKKCLEEYRQMGCQGIVSNVIVEKEMELFCQKYKDKFIMLVEEYIDLIIEEIFDKDGTLFDFNFVNIILAILQYTPMRPTCTEGVQSLTMGIDGKVGACYLSKQSIGNFMQSKEINNEAYLSFLRPDECKECWCHHLCQCWCREMNEGKIYEPRCMFNQLTVKKLMNSIYKHYEEDQLHNLIDKLKMLQNLESF